MTTLTLATWNSNGLNAKRKKIENAQKIEKIDLIFITETWTCEDTDKNHEKNVYFSSHPRLKEKSGRPHAGIALILHPSHHNASLRILYEDKGLALIFELWGITFFGIYLSPSLDEDECLRRLFGPQAAPFWESPGEKVLLGDLNMKLGALTEDTTVLRQSLHRHIEANELILQTRSGLSSTYFNRNLRHRSTVDYIYASPSLASTRSRLDVLDSADLGTGDHRPIVVTFANPAEPIEPTTAAQPSNMTKWRLCKLTKERVAESYMEALEMRLQPLLPGLEEALGLSTKPHDAQKVIDSMYQRFTDGIRDTADQCLGRVDVCAKDRKKKEWITPGLRAARKVRRQALATLRFLEALDKVLNKADSTWSDQKQNAWSALKLADKEERTAELDAEKELELIRCEAMERLSGPAMLKKLRSMKNGRTKKKALLPCDAKSMATYSHFFSEQFARQAWQPRLESAPEVSTENMDIHVCGLSSHISVWGVRRAICNSQNGKTPGASGISVELLKAGGDAAVTILTLLFKIFASWTVVPTVWRTALIVPVPKKGDLTVISNYRPISLLEVPRKIFESVTLQSWLLQDIEPLDIAQGGFRAGRATIDQAACLHEAMVQSSRRTGKQPLVAYLDIKAAYDSVDREILWQKLSKRDVDGHTIRLLKALYDGCRSKVVLSGAASPPLTHNMGVMQGSVMSPILYCAFLDDIAQEVEDLISERFGSSQAGIFLYADDIAVVSENPRQLQAVLDKLSQYSLRNNFRFAPAKCAVVGPGKVEVTLYEQPVPVVSHFIYLGVVFGQNGIDYLKMGSTTSRWDRLPQDGIDYLKMGSTTSRWDRLPRAHQKIGSKGGTGVCGYANAWPQCQRIF
jgi:hypothetical protein